VTTSAQSEDGACLFGMTLLVEVGGHELSGSELQAKEKVA